MAWLVCEGRVLASAEVAVDRRERAKGLLGRDGIDGALVLRPCRWVHTVGMQFPIDVAYVDGEGTVVKTVQMHRRRVGVPVFRASMVIEAAAGAFARWGLRVGDVIEIRGDHHDAAPDAGASGGQTEIRPAREHGERQRSAVAAPSR